MRWFPSSRLGRAVLGFVLVVLLPAFAGYNFYWSARDGARTAAYTGPPDVPLRIVPELAFIDASQKPRSLSEFRGRLILLNIWATWCTPCRKEMPALDRLQQALGSAEFEVVALSIDNGGPAVVRRFYDEIGVRALAVYVDPASEVTGKLRTLGVPTTLLIDREGREIWRKTGAAEWDTKEVVESLRLHLRGATNPKP